LSVTSTAGDRNGPLDPVAVGLMAETLNHARRLASGGAARA